MEARYLPDEGGPRALFGYTGLANLSDGTPTGTWIRETLRGETESFDHSMEHLRSRLDRDIGPEGHSLIINLLVTEGERRLAGGFTNLARDRAGAIVFGDAFKYALNELDGPRSFASGSGGVTALRERLLEPLESQLEIRPRKPLDHMNLLATVNRRVAAIDRTVSPFCHAIFTPAKIQDGDGGYGKTFLEPGESAPFDWPSSSLGSTRGH